MEPAIVMRRIVFELKDADSPIRTVAAEISIPYERPNGSFCWVRLPGILNDDKRIAGMDDEHALEQATAFVHLLLERRISRVVSTEDIEL